MSIESQSSGPNRRTEGEIQETTAFDESTALIRKTSSNADDEEVGETSKIWSPHSLGSGFIWIETGASHALK